MERVVDIHIEKLQEGVYLATSDELQGLVAQGRIIRETIEIARDVAGHLIESQKNERQSLQLRVAEESFDYQLIVG